MKTALTIITVCFIVSCATSPTLQSQVPQEVLIKIQGVDTVRIEEKSKEGDGISRTMAVDNPKGQLSHLSFISGNKAFIKIFSGLSTADVTQLWNDFCILEYDTKIRDINLYINSPGGDAYSGLALADQIERARKRGFKITAHASGIIASAAVPVFAVCDVRLAAPGTIFMVHETSIYKWPGRETASNIRSQNELMELIRDRYIEKLVNNSKLNKARWEELEKKTTWFSTKRALEWGLVDRIE